MDADASRQIHSNTSIFEPDAKMTDTVYLNELLDEFKSDFEVASNSHAMLQSLNNEDDPRDCSYSFDQLDMKSQLAEMDNFEPADLSMITKDFPAKDKKPETAKHQIGYLKSNFEGGDVNDLSCILSPEAGSDRPVLQSKVTSSISEFFRNVDKKFEENLREKLSVNETMAKGRIMTPEELVSSLRKRFSLIPEPEPEHREELKREKVSLVHIFKLYAEAHALCEERTRISTASSDNPLESLEDTTIFAHRPSFASPKQRADLKGLIEESTDSDVPASRGLLSLGLSINVENYPKLNNLKARTDVSISSFYFSGDMLLLGATDGLVYEISVSEDRKIHQYKVNASMMPVCCIDANEEGDLFAAGTTGGSLLIRSAKKGWGKKVITDRFGGQPVNKVKFVGSKDLLVLAGGIVLRMKILKVSALLEVPYCYSVIKVDSPDLCATKFEFFREKYSDRLLIASPSQISFYRVKPSSEDLEFALPRPAEVSATDMVMMSLIGSYSVYSIVWGRYLFVIKKLNILDEGDPVLGSGSAGNDKPNLGCFEILERVEVTNRSFDLGFMFNKHGLLMFKKDGWVKIAGIGNFSQFIRQGAQYEDMEIPFSEIPGFSKKLKGFISNLENKSMRLTGDDSLLVLDDNQFKRIALIDIDQLIQFYVNAGEWHQAIKIAIRMFKSTRSDDKNRQTVKEIIRIISLKYIDYFLTSMTLADQSAEYVSTDKIAEKRLQLIIQTLISADSIDFVFTELRKKLKPVAFWLSVGELIDRGVHIPIKGKYLSQDIVVLKQSTLELLIKQADLENSDEDCEENLNRLCQSLKKAGRWSSIYFVCIQSPQTKLTQLFLSMLMNECATAQARDLQRYQSILNADYLRSLYSSPHIRETITADPCLDRYLRLFYYLRRFVHLKDMTYLRNMEFIWKHFFEWMLDKTNLSQLGKIGLNLALEVLCEALLKNDLILNLSVLQFIVVTIRKAKSIHQFQLIDHLNIISKKCIAKMDDNELRSYATKTVCELLEYLLEVFINLSDTQNIQEIGFLCIKIFNISLFKPLVKDTPFCLTFLRLALSQPFEYNRFYYFFKIINKDEFEQVIADASDKILAESRIVSSEMVAEFIQLADSSG